MAFISTPLATRRSRSPGSETAGDTTSGREVRSVDFTMAYPSSPRCLACRKDRQKCTRKDPNQVKCNRCSTLSYNCAIDDANAPLDGKRRKLQRLKCEACRSAKVKCEPIDRSWPDKCCRCQERSLPCSKPQVSNKKRIQTDDRTAETPRSVEDDSDDESDVDHSVTIRNRGQAGPKTPAHPIVQDVGRPIRKPEPKFKSDYPYTDLKDDEFRLLILHHGVASQDISCSVSTERLRECRPYQALSHRWTDDVESKPIMIIDYKKSASKSKSFKDFRFPKIYTQPNIVEALQQLRHPEHDITLYVNAICINHKNKDEKHHQSARTQEIFNKASNVIVWLGTEKPTSKTAFEFIPKVLDMHGFDKLVKEEYENGQCWDALAELMGNSLFSRRWLIPELAVAKNAALHCGPHTIPWTDFSDAVALFKANLPEIQKSFKHSVASGGPIHDIRALGASTLVSVVNNIIRKTPDGQILNRLHGVETLVSILAVFEVTNPLDTIFAVMGLAKDEAQLESIIDADMGILDNFIDFMACCMKSSQSIDIICCHWAPVMNKKALAYIERNSGAQSVNVQLPSWIPSVSGSAFGAPEDKDKQPGRVHGDSFVGLPDHRIYNASLGFPPPQFTFGRRPHPDWTTFAQHT